MPSRTGSIAALLLGLALTGSILRAQEPDPPPDAKSLHTLHVYMDLIQVPVLVLDNEFGRLKLIEPTKFLVSLDSGPTFRPRHVRQQGDDPITLAILLDVNGAPSLMPHIADAIAALAPNSLHPKDHITVYGLDCTLNRSIHDIPADSASLKAGVEDAIASWTERRKVKHPAPCASRVNLWDALGFAVHDLSEMPGRRILLAVTDGIDHGSSLKWNSLRSYAQLKSVAIFGYTPRDSGTASFRSMGPSGGRSFRSAPSLPAISDDGTASENPFSSICQLSGAMVMPADPEYVPKQLTRFVTTVRERYILEFARARNDTPGEHSIVVTVPSHPLAYIRPAGVTMVLDTSRESDPDTIPRDTTDAPEIGKRKPIKPQH